MQDPASSSLTSKLNRMRELASELATTAQAAVTQAAPLANDKLKTTFTAASDAMSLTATRMYDSMSTLLSQQLPKPTVDSSYKPASPSVQGLGVGMHENKSLGDKSLGDAQHNQDGISSTPLDLPDILSLVLKHLDDDTLLTSVPVVCKEWRDAVHAPILWQDRVDASLLNQCNQLTQEAPAVTMPGLYLALHSRNFLRNPAFHKGLNADRAAWNKWHRNAWVINTPVGQGVEWETFTPAANPDSPIVPPPPPMPYPLGGNSLATKVHQRLRNIFSSQLVPGCVATSHDWAEVVQVVYFKTELQRRGLSPEQAEVVLDSGLSLKLSLMVSGGANSSGEYAVGLLLDEGADHMPQIQSFVQKPSRHHYYIHDLFTSRDPGDWHKFEYRVDACPKGFRRAVVILRGRHTKRWPGHHGAKFASAELVFQARE